MEHEQSKLTDDKPFQIYIQAKKPPLPSKYLQLVQQEKVKKPLVGTCDILLSLLILSPCVVGFWRGTWTLQDVYKTYFPPWFCLLVGVVFYTIVVIIQDSFNTIAKEKMNARLWITTRVYTYVFAVSSTMMWRGGWAYMDAFLGVEMTPFGTVLKKGSGNMMAACGVAFLCIVGCRSLRNCVAPPFVFCTDRKRHTFIIPTRFRTKVCIVRKAKMRGSTAGLPDSLKTHHNASYYAVLSVLDAFFSSLVVAPLVVGYWRSVWELMAIYVYPEDELISSSISTVLGIVGHLVFMLLQHAFERYLHPDRNRILFYVVSRVYTVCFAFICVNGWRGPWQLLDLYTKNEMLTVVAPTILGIVALAAMRALRNVSATPFAVSTDSVKGYFDILTMFRVTIGENAALYILDCLFSVLVVGTLVVFVWRGAWALVDIYLFPENEIWSAWASLIIGYTAVAIAFILQPLMRWLCDRITGVARLLVADLFLILSLIGTVNVWRGIWNLLNLYLLPDNLELSCWITHWVCLIVLVLLGCSNSLLVRGVYIDAEEPAGKCVVFPCYYLRLIFQEQKLKKLDNERNKAELVNVNNHIQILEVNHKEGDV